MGGGVGRGGGMGGRVGRGRVGWVEELVGVGWDGWRGGALAVVSLALLHLLSPAGVSIADSLLQRCWWHPPHWQTDHLHAPAGPLERLHPVPRSSPAGCA